MNQPNNIYTDPNSDEGRSIRACNEFDGHNKLDRNPAPRLSPDAQRASDEADKYIESQAFAFGPRRDHIRTAFEVGYLRALNHQN